YLGRDHTLGVPGPPIDGNHAAGPRAIQTHGQLVQHLVGSGIVALSAVAEASGDRGKEQQEFEAFRPQFAAQNEGPVHRGVEDPVEALLTLVVDELVFDDSGTVNDAIQPAEGSIDTVDERTEGLRVPNIDRIVVDPGAKLPQRSQGATNFALGN